MPWTVELLSQSAGTSPHIPKSSTVQPTSPTIVRLSVQEAVKAVGAQEMTHKAAAAACGVSPGTIFNTPMEMALAMALGTPVALTLS